MVLELTEVALDVICIEYNITVWIFAAQVVHSLVESMFYSPKLIVQLSK